MKIFLCHSNKDKDFVRRLASDLVLNRVNVWYDEWNLNWGDSLIKKIQGAIVESSFLAIVLSPDSVASEWVNLELNTAWMVELEKKSVFVLPILHRPCEMPAFLKDKICIDFTKSYENGLNNVLKSLEKFRGEPVYLNFILNNITRRPYDSVQPSLLVDIIDNVGKLNIDKAIFDFVFAKTLMTNLFLGKLYDKGLSFYSEEELINKNLSIRPLPYPEHSEFCVKYALNKEMWYRDICEYSGYSYEDIYDSGVHHQLIRKAVDVVTNLYNIGSGKVINDITGMCGVCGRYNKTVYRLALMTRNYEAFMTVLDNACMAGEVDPARDVTHREQATESIAENIDIVPTLRQYLIHAFESSQSHVQYHILRNMALFPHELRLLFCRIGIQREYGDIKQLAQDYLNKVNPT